MTPTGPTTPPHTTATTTRDSSIGSPDLPVLAPPTTRTRRRTRFARPTRARALVALTVSLLVLVVAALAAAGTDPHGGPRVSLAAAVQPPVLPIPTVDPDPCGSLPLPVCGTVPPTASTTPSTPPCTGEGCIPQPGTTTTPAPGPGTGQPGQGGEEEDDCGITDPVACVTEAINALFRGIVTEALNPLLDLLGRTLLTTPMPDSLPRLGELWDNSWQILLIAYGLLVLIAGVIAMSYQTLQTRHSIKELLPRLVVGFLSGALSLWVATKGIQIANALVAAIMGGGVDATTAGQTLRNLVIGSLNGGLWIIFIGLFLAGMLIALLITYVVRVALTLLLIGGAPLALMFHALPQTEGIGYWWWKAYGGCLAIQIGQSLTLITGVKVFLAPGGFTVFGPTVSGLVNLLVALALMYILFKIPFWVLGSIRGGGGGRSLIGGLVKGFLAYKTFGLLGGGGGGRRGPRPTGTPKNGGRRDGAGDGRLDPYKSTRATAGGQLMLPLPGVRRTRPTTAKKTPTPTATPTTSGKGQGRQLALPLGEDWPENKPVLGRDGQYRLPLDVQPAPVPPVPPSAADPGVPRAPRKRARQPELPFDPYQGNRPTSSGQYPLPLDGVRRVPRPPAPTPPPPTPPTRRSRATQPELPFDPYKGIRPTSTGQHPLPLDGVRRVPPPAPGPSRAPVPPTSPSPRPRVTQPELPFDPYKGIRPTSTGQYPLPLDGVRRTPAAPPAPPTPTPPGPSRPAPRAGKQLRLPLDLPKPPTPPRFTPPPPQPPVPPPAARPTTPKPGGKP
ncbi:hypothetical protein CLV40_13846 [Actinokineospora auranticolor]|uniref:TrbL/VirB6 plasmid conjugal transfer protein n=1 Tax=Actinokineospora auranticolor TaxID=155976 RepID=A0A2S6GC06_9PSEU|nr:hypothetical protein CLV40_13846 [Actinokineospora auranticolor]